jgi:hypothetical protein
MIPNEILDWFRMLFEDVNRSVTEQMQNVPNIPEPHLDTCFISHLMGHSSPMIIKGEWAVRIDTHFIGSLAQFGRWEIADIGVFIFFQQRGKVVRRKVALLQSKRLYPNSGDVTELDEFDYRLGMARLGEKDESAAKLLAQNTFSFTEDSSYQALQNNHQVERIKRFSETNDIPVYYLLYNPATLPTQIITPLSKYERIAGDPTVGARVLPATDMFQILDGVDYFPSVSDVRKHFKGRDEPISNGGWRLAYFMSDLLIGCYEGKRFSKSDDAALYQIFNRRSGPIVATVSVIVQMPDDAVLPE